MLLALDGHAPEVAPSAYVAPMAIVIGPRMNIQEGALVALGSR